MVTQFRSLRIIKRCFRPYQPEGKFGSYIVPYASQGCLKDFQAAK